MLWIKSKIQGFLFFTFLCILLSSSSQKIIQEQGPLWSNMENGDVLKIKTLTSNCFSSQELEMIIEQDELGLVIQVSKNSNPSFTVLKKKSFKLEINNYLQHIGFQGCGEINKGGFTIIQFNQNPPDTIFGCPSSALF